MPCTLNFSNALSAVTLGARAAQQAAAFGLCFALGLAAGIFALLYLRKSSPLERVLCDLFATLALAVGALLCTEFFLGGKPELYGIFAYLVGASVLSISARFIKRRIASKRANDRQNNAK